LQRVCSSGTAARTDSIETAEIDAALAEMAQDPEYQAEVLKMETEW